MNLGDGVVGGGLGEAVGDGWHGNLLHETNTGNVGGGDEEAWILGVFKERLGGLEELDRGEGVDLKVLSEI